MTDHQPEPLLFDPSTAENGAYIDFLTFDDGCKVAIVRAADGTKLGSLSFLDIIQVTKLPTLVDGVLVYRTPEEQAATPGIQPLQCGICRQSKRGTAPPRCQAFPDGIPLVMLLEDFDHREPYPGDNGIRFTPMPPRQPEGPFRFVFVHRIHRDNSRSTVGVLWTGANDTLGYIAAGGWGAKHASTWENRVDRTGDNATQSAEDIIRRWRHVMGGAVRGFDCSAAEDTPDLDAIRAALAPFARIAR